MKGIVRRAFVALFAAVITAAAAFASADGVGNLLTNAEFAGDGLGMALNWSLTNVRDVSPANDVTFAPQTGPDGETAVRFRRCRRDVRFQQFGLRLVDGEAYRLSAWFRIRNLPAKAARFMVHSSNWGRTDEFELPADTDGKWVRIESSGNRMGKSPDGRYTVKLFFQEDMPEDAVVEMCRPELTALSERGRKQSVAAAPEPKKGRFRIVPIDPKLYEVDPRTGEIEFYYPADLDRNFADYDLSASVDGVLRATAPFAATRRVRLALGPLGESRHALFVWLSERKSGRIVAGDRYTIRPKKAVTFESGRKLNNFVTELASAPLENRDYEFVNPREGFVFIGLSGCGDAAEARLDGGTDPVVRFRSGEPLQTMRDLTPGRHVVTVSGARGGRIDIRAVKPIVAVGPHYGDEVSDLANYHYGEDFHRRFCYPWCNMIRESRFVVQRAAEKGTDASRFAEKAERGFRLTTDVSMDPRGPTRTDRGTIIRSITQENCGWKCGWDVMVDENEMNLGREKHEIYAEALWRILATSSQCIHTFWADGGTYPFTDPRVRASEIAAIVNAGDGRSMNALEAYSSALPDFAEACRREDRYLEFSRSAVAMVPAARGSVYYHVAPYVFPGEWDDWSSPRDYRVLLDHLFRRLATDPAFGEGLWGVGTSAFQWNDEETVRWVMALLRHYAVLGRTDSLAENLGYRYEPEYVTNGDFDSGFEGWRTGPAAEGSLKVETIRDYGRKMQGRKKVAAGVGDNLAVFVRTAEGPNRLSQKVSGLKPGRLYSLLFITADYDNYLQAPGNDGKDVRFRVTFDGAEELRELRSVCPGASYSYVKKGHRFNYRHRHVFRATAPEATIVFEDRADGEGDAVTDGIGRKRLMNFVLVREYFTDDLRDLDEIVDLAKKGRGR